MAKICTKCGKEKPLSEFYFRKDSGKYRNECKECFSEKTKDFKNNRFPWRKHFYSARRRCNNVNDSHFYRYGKRNIKFLLKINTIKELWFRDKAYEMERPSIDRIDNDGDYTFENCRFIEHSENTSKAKRKKVLQLDLNKNIIAEWKSATEASVYLNKNRKCISQACRLGLKINNYIWIYKE